MSKIIYLITLTALLKIVTVSADGAGHDWSYDTTIGRLDPSMWYKHYPSCGGQKQSPIDVIDSAVKTDSSLKPLKFINYDVPLKNLVMKNNGHSIEVTIPKEANVSISSPSLPVSYRLIQFHFHWPSEHSINGYEFPLELHLVHAHSQLSDEENKKNKDGLVVVAVLFDYRKGSTNGPAMKNIISQLGSTDDEGETVTLSSLTLKDLLPANPSSYVRYSGSLTTPPCAEVVEFHILTNTLPIGKADIAKFTALRHEILNANNEETNEVLIHNDRPLQKLNGRPLRLYGDIGDLPSKSIFQSIKDYLASFVSF